MFKFILFIFLCFFLISCDSEKKSEELDLGDMIAKGEIKDSIYNGKISFYNKATGKLIAESNYINGVLNGEYKKYNDSNKVIVLGNYNDGLPNGYSYVYDGNGKLKVKSFIYYNIRVGACIQYLNDKPKKYYYYSLDNKLLFYIDYDSINGKGILDIAKNFFFINSYNVDNTTDEYRLYNINPPKYNFKYSLVTVDENKKIKDTIQEFNSNNIWHKFDICLQPKLPANTFYAINIFIKDSVNGRDCVMLKLL